MAIKTWCGQKVSKLKFAYFSWLARHLPACEEITPLISQNLDGPLSFRNKVKMVLHKHMCAWCQRYADQLLLIRKALRKQDSQPDLTLSSEAREQIKRSLREQ
jgi:hypothetical protein